MRAALGSLVFFIVAPGTVAGLIPWWLTNGWANRTDSVLMHAGGGLLIAAGLAVLVHSFARFVVEGLGTPAPVAPTKHLVVGGLYRYVRNPMYVAIIVIVLGQALALGESLLLAYAAVTWAVPAAFVKAYEEPTLLRTYGEQYETYRRNVPAWIPRLTPWTPSAPGSKPNRE